MTGSVPTILSVQMYSAHACLVSNLSRWVVRWLINSVETHSPIALYGSPFTGVWIRTQDHMDPKRIESAENHVSGHMYLTELQHIHRVLFKEIDGMAEPGVEKTELVPLPTSWCPEILHRDEWLCIGYPDASEELPLRKYERPLKKIKRCPHIVEQISTADGRCRGSMHTYIRIVKLDDGKTILLDRRVKMLLYILKLCIRQTAPVDFLDSFFDFLHS